MPKVKNPANPSAPSATSAAAPQVKKQQKSPFSIEFLAQINQKLKEEEARLQKELAKFSKPNPEVEGDYNASFPDFGNKDDENAAEVAQYSTDLTLEQTLESMLRDVHNQLKRMESGAYGICKYCGNPIEEKRLLARPTSSSCVACKKTITQEI